MGSPSKASASIVASGVLEIIGSVMVGITTLFGFIGLSFMPISGAAPALPAGILPIARSILLFVLGIAIFGVFTGVALIQLKNWARIVTIVWAALMTLFCGLIVLLFMVAPIPTPANQPANMQHLLRIFILLIYGMPLGIGAWWLILFNTKSIVLQFADVPLGGQFTEPSVIPRTAIPTSFAPIPAVKPKSPLPVMIVGDFPSSPR